VPTSGVAARGDTPPRSRVQGLEPTAGIGTGCGAGKSQHQRVCDDMTIETDPGTGLAGHPVPTSAVIGPGALLTSSGVTTIGGPNRSGMSRRTRRADGLCAVAMPAAARNTTRTQTARRSPIRRMRPPLWTSHRHYRHSATDRSFRTPAGRQSGGVLTVTSGRVCHLRPP